jgi:hypothetical protein
VEVDRLSQGFEIIISWVTILVHYYLSVFHTTRKLEMVVLNH